MNGPKTISRQLLQLGVQMREAGYAGSPQPLTARWLSRHDCYRVQAPEGDLFVLSPQVKTAVCTAPYLLCGREAFAFPSSVVAGTGAPQHAFHGMNLVLTDDMSYALHAGEHAIASGLELITSFDFIRALGAAGLGHSISLYNYASYERHIKPKPTPELVAGWKQVFDKHQYDGRDTEATTLDAMALNVIQLADELYQNEPHLPDEIRKRIYTHRLPHIGSWLTSDALAEPEAVRLMGRWIDLGNRFIIRDMLVRLKTDYCRLRIDGEWSKLTRIDVGRCGDALLGATGRLFPRSVTLLEAYRDVLLTALKVGDWLYAQEVYDHARTLDDGTITYSPTYIHPEWLRADIHALGYSLACAHGDKAASTQAAQRSLAAFDRVPDKHHTPPSSNMMAVAAWDAMQYFSAEID